MISGHISLIDRDAPSLTADILAGLRFLATTDLARLPAGRTDIDGDRMFALISDYETAPKGTKRPESHRRHLDIQYVASGREMIGYAPLNRAGAVAEDLSADRDLIFYAGVDGETDLVMETGDWAVFYPTDIHRPGCRLGAAEKVRKVVIKIRL